MLDFGMGLEPDNFAGCHIKKGDYYAFIELHVEQGAYLLHDDLPIAVVSAIAGIKQFYITLKGVTAHAGGMAMEDRHDTMAVAAAIACEVERLALSSGRPTRGTVGYIEAHPAEHNIIADQAIIPVDFREDDVEVWEKLYTDLMSFVEDQCQKRGLQFSVKSTINTPPAQCSPQLIDLVDSCATEAGIPHKRMVSYPAHDAMQMARLYPMGMIFLRSSNNGVAHSPDEYTTPEDMTAGTTALLKSIVKLAETDLLG